MVNIKFSPTRSDDMELLTVKVKGFVLTVNGEVFDFSPLQDGDSLHPDAVESLYFTGDITCTDGDLNVALLMPYRPTEEESILFPATVSVKTGTVKVPTDSQKVKVKA